MILSNDAHIYLFIMFLLGLTTPPKSLVAYTHLIEFFPGKESLICGRFLFLDGLVLVVSPIILSSFTKNTEYLIWTALIMNTIAFIGMIIY
jgi:hypothetical protein